MSHLTITEVQRGVNALPTFENRNSKIGLDGSQRRFLRVSSFDFRISIFVLHKRAVLKRKSTLRSADGLQAITRRA